MKRLFTIIIAVLLTSSLFAQLPQKMSYQAVIRNSSNALVTNTQVGMQISILQGSASGTVVYSETQTPTTNANGLVSIIIGGGVGFDAINWANDIYFIKTETDPTGGSTYTISGTTQLLSVPYALHAKTVASYNETDPVFIAHAANGITGTNIANWTTAFGWGNHASAGYLTSFTELDPAVTSNFDFTGAASNDLLRFNGTKWVKFTPDYLTNFTELDPVFVAHAASGVTSTLIGNWNTAFGWGDHSGLYRPIGYVPAWGEITDNPFSFVSPADNQLLKYNTISSKWENWTPDFLTTEVDGSITNEIQTLASVLAEGTDAGNNKIVNVNQQGIGTSTPNASSALEISSTTQGFLPPRMTVAQRNTITPVNGLMIYNTDTNRPNYYNGFKWINYDGTSAEIAIGSYYQGGIIAYILQSGDLGYDANVQHGLIASPSDQSNWAEWGCWETTISGADGTVIGTGNQNTIDIVTGCTTAGIAAKLCYDLTLDGYTDWYLPSKDELNKLYINKSAIGGFVLDGYWSSTEVSTGGAWYQYFFDGYQGGCSKDYPTYVRAIRSF